MNQIQVDPLLMKNRTPLDESTLVSQLNDLLTSLRIPIPLISPTDLTPRLLIAILESIMGMRSPVVEHQDDSQDSKVQNMKIFLGVLETDILRVDVGLSLLDPRRLASGEREAVMFIAELLCWVGRRLKLIKPKMKAPADVSSSHSRSSTPIVSTPNQKSKTNFYPATPKSLSQLDADAASVFQTGSTWTDPSTPLNNSPFTIRPFDDESFTSLNTDDLPLLQPPFEQTPIGSKQDIKDDDELSSVSNILGGLPESWNSVHRERPRCIHEIPPPPSILNSRSNLPLTPPRESTSNLSTDWWCPEHPEHFCMCNFSGRSPPVRYDGYIEPVDQDSEVASFELSRSISMSTTPDPSFDDLPQDEHVPTVKSVREQYTRTLELLNERARLLTHLAKLKNSDPFG